MALARLGVLLPLHYVNMGNPSYERVACGFAKSAEGNIWSVQNFR